MIVEPGQPLAVGIIEYWTVPPRAEVKVWLIGEPLPATLPETVPEVTTELQLKVVPTILLSNVIEVGEPLQIEAVLPPPIVATGIGFTITSVVSTELAQEPVTEVAVIA
jgi:hypothetical protein